MARLGRHLRADGARRERHLGHRRHGQSRPRRLLRGRRLRQRAADAQGRLADRGRHGGRHGRRRDRRRGRRARHGAPARRLSRDRHARLRRDDPHRREQRDLADQRHRRPLRHSRARAAARCRPERSTCSISRSSRVIVAVAYRRRTSGCAHRRSGACCARSATTSRWRRSPASTSRCSR